MCCSKAEKLISFCRVIYYIGLISQTYTNTIWTSPVKITSKSIFLCVSFRISIVQKQWHDHCFSSFFFSFPLIFPSPYHSIFLTFVLFVSDSNEVCCLYCFDAMSGNFSRLLLILEAWWINHLPPAGTGTTGTVENKDPFFAPSPAGFLLYWFHLSPSRFIYYILLSLEACHAQGMLCS